MGMNDEFLFQNLRGFTLLPQVSYGRSTYMVRSRPVTGIFDAFGVRRERFGEDTNLVTSFLDPDCC